MLELVGFGEFDDRIAVLRKPGQSFTCREQRAAVNVQNDADFDIAFVRIDGGYFPEGDSCDYSVSAQTEMPLGLLIELKGRDVEHAMEQLERTIFRLRERGVCVRYRLAAVVSSGCAKMPSARWEKAVKLFWSRTGVRLGRFANCSSVSFFKAVA